MSAVLEHINLACGNAESGLLSMVREVMAFVPAGFGRWGHCGEGENFLFFLLTASTDVVGYFYDCRRRRRYEAYRSRMGDYECAVAGASCDGATDSGSAAERG